MDLLFARQARGLPEGAFRRSLFWNLREEPTVRIERSVWLVGEEVTHVTVFFCADRTDHFRVVVQPIPGTADKILRFISVGTAQVAALDVFGDRDTCQLQSCRAEVHVQDEFINRGAGFCRG